MNGEYLVRIKHPFPWSPFPRALRLSPVNEISMFTDQLILQTHNYLNLAVCQLRPYGTP